MNNKPLAKNLVIPIKPDSVLSPEVYYGEPVTGIYFTTDDDQYGRITFENLDSLRVSRGEYLPYEDDWREDQPYCWVARVENSAWLKERYSYEKKHYGTSYEWGGNVDDMLTDFSHYIFSFHDEFIEVIARGFWYEKDTKSLVGRALLPGHPTLPLSETAVTTFEAHGLKCQVRSNPRQLENLQRDAQYHSQTLMEFALELEGEATVDHSLVLAYRNGKLVSKLLGYFGKQEMEFDHIPTLEEVKPVIEKYMKEVLDRRKAMGKEK